LIKYIFEGHNQNMSKVEQTLSLERVRV